MDYAKERGICGSEVNIDNFTVFTATDCMGKRVTRYLITILHKLYSTRSQLVTKQFGANI